MKKKLTIKCIFNDQFTNYRDKESSVTMIVDLEKHCDGSPYKTCWIHKDTKKYILTDIE